MHSARCENCIKDFLVLHKCFMKIRYKFPVMYLNLLARILAKTLNKLPTRLICLKFLTFFALSFSPWNQYNHHIQHPKMILIPERP